MAAPWTLASAISPTGQWGKVWLAAHLEKKLKKEDFEQANIQDLVSSILKSSNKLTLRYMGNFLLGMCKILAKQNLYFEERTQALHDNLMIAFTHKDDGEHQKKTRAIGSAAEARLVAMEAASDAMVVDEELEKVLASRKYLAQMEEITLKPAVEDALTTMAEGMQIDTFGAASAVDMAALQQLTKKTKRAFLKEALPLMSSSDSLVPLVDIPLEERRAIGDDGLGLLEPDLEPLDDGDIAMLPPDELVLQDRGLGDEPDGKRRKRYFAFDDPTEIQKEVYQGYMTDRTAINRKDECDSTILLPHYSPAMPQFITTYTDMCTSLIQGLSWGSQVAERRRAALALAEGGGMPSAFPGMWPEAPTGEPSIAGELDQPPLDIVPAPADDPWKETVVHLDMSDAPANMGLVIKVGGEEEEQSAVPEAARVGYSGRTEKMHKFLAKEFQNSKPNQADLSYEKICKKQSGGDRGVIAGCFFELLVLRTNGVVNLRQDTPYSDIKIEKARAWGTTS